MSDLNHLPLTVGAAKPAQKAAKIYEITAADRLLLGGTLLWCFLAVDTFLFAPVWGIGLTAAVVLWYFLLLAALGRKTLFRRESAILLAVNLFLAATFALQSNSWIRGWNVLALLVLVPVHPCGLSTAMQFPWWRPRMLWERAVCFFSGLFSAVGAPFAALMPAGKSRDSRRLLSTVLGCCGAAVLLCILVPVLSSADALFAAATADLRRLIRSHFTTSLAELLWALILTPFLFSLLYRLRRPLPSKALLPEKTVSADGTGFWILLAALDVLYFVFLLVQSAGLFGGPEYLSARGLSYAQWARSGFFQMVGVTIVNLSVLLAAVTFSHRQGRGWTTVRLLSGVLIAESLVLLASAAWRMSLYVGAYGLSFKRLVTYWGMGMMALFFLAALWKLLRTDRSFCRLAFPIALAGWVLLNCVPLDALVARDQVDRVLSGETAVLDVEYLLEDLSYDTLPQLARLDGSRNVYTQEGKTTLEALLTQRRSEARAECSDWRAWNLSAWRAAADS